MFNMLFLNIVFSFVYVNMYLQVCKSQRCCSSYKQWRNETSEAGKPRTKTDISAWAVYDSPVPSQSMEAGCVFAMCSLPHKRTSSGRRDPHLSCQRDRTRPASPIFRYQFQIWKQYYHLSFLFGSRQKILSVFDPKSWKFPFDSSKWW